MLYQSLFYCVPPVKKNFRKETAGRIIIPVFIFLATGFLPQALLAQQPGPKTKSLFQAIRSGETASLEQQLKNGADPNDSLEGFSALMAAALNGTADQMKMLIDRGAQVNFVAADGSTALWLAIPDWDKTNLLLSKGADIHHKIGGYGILVKLASMPGTSRLFKLFMEKGADPRKNAADNYVIYNAAASGDTAILGPLIRLGMNVNDTMAFGDFPVNGALFYRCHETLRMLVDNGADVNSSSGSAFLLESFKGFTPLMYAAVNNDKRSFYYLLKRGANPNLKNKNGYTALMLLQQAEEDDPAMTKALLDLGAEPSTKTPAGNDALYFAMQKGNTQSAQLLKKYANK